LEFFALLFRRSEKAEEAGTPTEETAEGDGEKPPKRKQVRFHSQAQFREIANMDDIGDHGDGGGSLSELRLITAEPVFGPLLRLWPTAIAAEPVIGPPLRLRSNSLTELSLAAGRTRQASGQAAVAAPRLKPLSQLISGVADSRAKTTISRK